MGVTIATTRVACNTGTGNQTITTTDLGGLTPKGALFLLSFASTDGTAADGATMSIGGTDGSTHWSTARSDQHGVTTVKSNDMHSVDAPIYMTNDAGSLIADADFNAWTTNGVTITWATAPGTAYLLTVIFFAGTDLSIDSGSESVGNTVDLATDITSVGFEADILILSISRVAASQLVQSNAYGQFGLVSNNRAGGIVQRCIAWSSRDNVGTSVIAVRNRTDSGITQSHITGTLDWYGEISAFDSSGFTITTRNDGGNNSHLKWLAIRLGSTPLSSWVGTYTSPTSTGNHSISTPGFTPQFVMQFLSLTEAADTTYTDNRAGSIGIGVMTSSAEYTMVITSEDAVTTTNTQSLSDDRAIVVPDGDGTLDIEATFVSMDANGWTVNYSNAPATAKLFWALAIEEEAAAGTVIKPGLAGGMKDLTGGMYG